MRSRTLCVVGVGAQEAERLVEALDVPRGREAGAAEDAERG